MGPDDINSRLAEIAAELASEAKFKEPSAAERARAARAAAAKPATPARGGPLRRWRAGRRAEKLRTPVRPPGAPEPVRQPSTRRARRAQRAAWAEGRPAADRGYSDTSHPSTRRSVLTVLIIVGLLVVVSIGARNLLHRGTAIPTGNSPGTSASAPSASSTPSASSSPVPTPASAFDPSAPFQGTLAADWASGSAGITIPAVHSYGQFSAGQVRAAYQTVRSLLIDGNLNERVLFGGARPTAFAGLLATGQRTWFEKNLTNNGLTKSKGPLSSRAWVTSFRPDSTALVGPVIRVHGTMSAKAARYDHQAVIRVHADYLFVYPVAAPGVAGSGLRVVRRVFINVEFGTWDEPASSRLVPWISTFLGGPAGVVCGDADLGYITPQFPTAASQQIQASGQPFNPYDQSTPPPAGNGCEAVDGT
jgi:hypothetical protein